MLRKIAAGTSAALIAIGLAAAPAVATGLTAVPGAVASEDPQSPLPDTSAARRKSSGPPPVGSPAPEVPSSPPRDDSGPGGPGPGDSGPPPSSVPPVETAGPPASPDFAPTPAPPEEPPPPPPPAEPRKAAEHVLPTAKAPTRLPLTAVDSRPLTVAGGASLIAAGLAWIGGARRRRPAGPPAG